MDFSGFGSSQPWQFRPISAFEGVPPGCEQQARASIALDRIVDGDRDASTLRVCSTDLIATASTGEEYSLFGVLRDQHCYYQFPVKAPNKNDFEFTNKAIGVDPTFTFRFENATEEVGTCFVSPTYELTVGAREAPRLAEDQPNESQWPQVDAPGAQHDSGDEPLPGLPPGDEPNDSFEPI